MIRCTKINDPWCRGELTRETSRKNTCLGKMITRNRGASSKTRFKRVGDFRHSVYISRNKKRLGKKRLDSVVLRVGKLLIYQKGRKQLSVNGYSLLSVGLMGRDGPKKFSQRALVKTIELVIHLKNIFHNYFKFYFNILMT